MNTFEYCASEIQINEESGGVGLFAVVVLLQSLGGGGRHKGGREKSNYVGEAWINSELA